MPYILVFYLNHGETGLSNTTDLIINFVKMKITIKRLVFLLFVLAFLTEIRPASAQNAFAPASDLNLARTGIFQSPDRPKEPLKPSRRDLYYGVGQSEIGLSVGVAHPITDIIGKPGTQFDIMEFARDNASIMGGLFFRHKVNYWFALNGGMLAARLQASNPDGFEYVFNETVEQGGSVMLHRFENDIAGLIGKMEFYLPYDILPGMHLFGFVGLAGYMHDPKVFGADGQLVVLETENRLIVPTLPVGVGLTYTSENNSVRIGLELGYQYVGRHSIDGISVRSTRYDSFLANQLTIGFLLPPRRTALIR